MVDETFGVREPSDCSDSEGENSPHFTKETLSAPVQLENGRPTATTRAVGTSPSQVPLTSSSDIAQAGPMMSTGITRGDGQGSSTKVTHSSGVLVTSRHNVDAEAGNNNVPVACWETGPTAAEKPGPVQDAAIRARTAGWDRLSQEDPADASAGPSESLREGLFDNSGSKHVRSAGSKGMNNVNSTKTAGNSSMHHRCTGSAQTTMDASPAAVLAASPPLGSEPNQPPQVGPTISDASAGEMVAQNGASQKRDEATLVVQPSTKSLVLRLVPGDCAFATVVPCSGEGSITSVGDLEKELQRKFRLRQPMRLAVVEVSQRVRVYLFCLFILCVNVSLRPRSFYFFRQRLLY